jgi:hypothetical protein
MQHSLYLQSHGAGRSSNEDLPLLIPVAEPLKAGLFFVMSFNAYDSSEAALYALSGRQADEKTIASSA